MTALNVATAAAVGCALAWGAKAIAIWQAGGFDRSAFESPLFFLGLAACLVAWAALGVALLVGRATWVRIAGGLVGVFVGLVLGVLALDALADGLVPQSSGWVREEAGLWASAIATLVAVIVVRANRPRTPTSDDGTAAG